MKSILSTYSGILKLQRETFYDIKRSRNGFRISIKLFVIICLIGSLGQWFGVGTILRQSTLPEQIHQLVALIEDIDQNIPGWLPQKMGENLSNFTQDVAEVVRKIEDKTTDFMPPLGARTSRVINIVGEWLETPLQIMAKFLGLSLILLLVMKLMGGEGTLSQHISLTMLAIAPYVLTFFSYIPSSSITMSLALDIFSRTLSILAIGWSVVILLKALSVAHGVTLKRSASGLILGLVVCYILIPLGSIITILYVLFG